MEIKEYTEEEYEKNLQNYHAAISLIDLGLEYFYSTEEFVRNSWKISFKDSQDWGKFSKKYRENKERDYLKFCDAKISRLKNVIRDFSKHYTNGKTEIDTITFEKQEELIKIITEYQESHKIKVLDDRFNKK